MILDESLLTELTGPVWVGVKILIMAGLGLYSLFAGIIVRQVTLMTDTLEVGFETPLRLIAVLHLLFALGTFLFALLIL